MTSHISEELPRILTGEASRDEALAAADHLRHCEDCRQELVSALVAHAALTSAQRFAPEVAAVAMSESLAPPAEPVPDLSMLFAQVREEAGERRPVRTRRTRLTVAAAAAAVVIGGGAAVLASQSGSSPSGHSVALAAVGTGHASATATFVGTDGVRINASALPAPDARHRYEVWLTNDARTQMQPVGWIGSNGKADLTVPQNLVRDYSDIEVSVQSLDAPSYTYSGTSVLRGAYSS